MERDEGQALRMEPMSSGSHELRFMYMGVLHYGQPRFLLKMLDGEPEVLDWPEVVSRVSGAAEKLLTPEVHRMEVIINGRRSKVVRRPETQSFRLASGSNMVAEYATIADLLRAITGGLDLKELDLRRGITVAIRPI